MFNECKMFLGMLLKEADKVWKPKYWFWWACLVVYMFVDTYNSIWLYWIGEPVTAERFNQALGINIMAGLVALIGVVQLYKAWKEER